MRMTKERAIEILTIDAERASIFEVAEAVDLAVDALKEKDEEREHMIKWFAKFCRHIDMPLHISDEEAEILWREKMAQQFGWISGKEESE